MKCTNGNKATYKTLERAKEARKSVQWGRNPIKAELYIYQCPYCGYYHLTKNST